MTKEELLSAINKDYDLAHFYSEGFNSDFLLQVTAHCTMLESASKKFFAFVDLPESDSRVLQIIKLVWDAVALAVPAIRFVKLIKAADTAARITQASAAAGMISLPGNTGPGRLGKAYKAVEWSKDKGEKLVGVAGGEQELTKPDPGPMSLLSKFDATKPMIFAIFEDAKKCKRYGARRAGF